MSGTAGDGAADPVLQHNLARLYGVATVPSDSSLRRRLDRVSPPALQRVFGRVFEVARRHKALAGFQALGGHYLLAVDGNRAVCLGVGALRYLLREAAPRRCCMTYYQQLLAAVLVHPSQSVVVPLAPELVLKSDGATKNDCEQQTESRLLPAIWRAHLPSNFQRVVNCWF